MAIQSLDLPIDIPWNRLGASADMIDTTFGDSLFPPKWRSSIAIFYHEPDELPEAYCDRRITYLKIAYTITGYQLDQKEVEFEFDREEQRFSSVPIVIRAKGKPSSNVWPRMGLSVNHVDIDDWEVNTPDGVYKTYMAKVDIARGQNSICVSFENDDGNNSPQGRSLFIDSVSVGPELLTPVDEGVLYTRRLGRFHFDEIPGQREMYYGGTLRFEIDFNPKDWMSQLIEEYNNIGAYLPCYGAILHVAVFPKVKFGEEVIQKCVDFTQLPSHNDHSNPLRTEGFEFHATDERNNTIQPATNFGPQALNLRRRMEIKLPAATKRIEAKIYHGRDVSVTVEVYKGNQRLAAKPVDQQPGQVHTIVLEGQDIDQVVFISSSNEAFLTKICYDKVVQKELGLEEYPYIMAFEPQKREMYETVTESGESMSRSLSNINVRKGFTSTASEEVLDIDMGESFAGAIEQGVTGATGGITGKTSGSYGYTQQKGTRNINTRQRENSATTDTSRESRETASHSTTLSQMYHLFNGYHLGTNRALFFMLPRPHVTEVTENVGASLKPVRTFANGPRKLEGVQEVFLVINPSKGSGSICVETLLETAHLDWKLTETTTYPKPEVSIKQLQTFLQEKYGGSEYSYWHGGDEETYHHHTEYVAWYQDKGHFASNGYRKEKDSIRQNDWGISFKDNYITHEEALVMYLQENPDKVPVPVVDKQTNTSMILTARSVKGCLPESSKDRCVEKSFPEAIADGKEWVSLETEVCVPRTVWRASSSNQLIQILGQKLQASLGSRERYPKEEVDFLHTKYALGKLNQHLAAMPDDDPNNKPIEKLGQLGPEQCKRLREAFPEVKTRKQALNIPLNQLRSKLKLSDVQARDLRLRLMGLMQKPGGPEEPPSPGEDEPPSPSQQQDANEDNKSSPEQHAGPRQESVS